MRADAGRLRLWLRRGWSDWYSGSDPHLEPHDYKRVRSCVQLADLEVGCLTRACMTAIWFHCKQLAPQPHCTAGMVGGINVPGSGQFSFAAFQQAAEKTSGTPGVRRHDIHTRYMRTNIASLATRGWPRWYWRFGFCAPKPTYGSWRFRPCQPHRGICR